MNYELTKREKKIARACLDIAFAAEIREGLEKSDAILQEWRNGKSEGDRTTYAALYQTIMDHEKSIYRKYNTEEANHLMLVASVYRDGYIDDNDIKDFSGLRRNGL